VACTERYIEMVQQSMSAERSGTPTDGTPMGWFKPSNLMVLGLAIVDALYKRRSLYQKPPPIVFSSALLGPAFQILNH
jgi:hypothetical protein